VNIKTSFTRQSALEAAGILKAVANPDRLMLLCQLLQGEHGVGELVGFLGLRKPAVSQHLAVLRRDGLVSARRHGQSVFYDIANPGLRRILVTLFALYGAAPKASHKPHREDQNMPNSDATALNLRDFSPSELRDALARQEVVLIDVREAGEHQSARIDGALLHPLSNFNPKILPPGDLVLYCAAGKRSRTAAELCAKAGVPVAGHLAGGVSAWVQAGLPVSRG